jgi:O-antigen ligase
MSAISLRAPVPRPTGATTRWVLGALALGSALGVAAAAQQTKIAIAVMVVPAVLALLAYPDWLPVVLVGSAFAEALFTGSLTLSRLAGPLAAVVIVLALPGRTGMRLPRVGTLVAIAAYGLWALASALWTVNPDTSLHLGGTGYALSALALSVVYMLAMVMFVRTERDLRRVLIVVWVGSSLTGLVSIAQYLSGYTRSFGLAGDANFFAALQVASLPLQAVLVNQMRRPGARAAVLGGLALTVGSIVTSLSRGGLLALAAVFLLLTFQPARSFFRSRAGKRAFLLVAALGAIVLLAASFSALSARTSSLFSTSDGGSGRTNLWLAALNGWHGHQVAGIGFGSFVGQSNELLLRTPGVDFSAYQLRPTGQVVHNAYLESMVELGVIGLFLFLGVLVTAATTLLQTARRAARAGATFISAFSRALLLSLTGFALASLFLSTETDRTLWVLLGLSIAVPRVLAIEQSRTADQPTIEAPARKETHDA